MKAVIVEKHNKFAVALDKSGAFIKIKDSGNYIIGAEIELPARSSAGIGTFQKLSSIAAAVLLLVSLGLGVYGYTTPYSYINVDINPSVEITSNIFDRIIKVEALNTDALKILNDTDYKNKSIEEGLDIILDSAAKEGYLTDEAKNAVMITVSAKSEKKVEEIKKSIEVEAKAEVKKEKVKAEIVVEDVKIEKHDAARKAGISPGKLLLIERLKEVEPSVEIEKYKDAPVKEIMKNIQAARKQQKENKKENKDKNDKKDDGLKDSKVQQDKDEGKRIEEASKPDVHKKNEKSDLSKRNPGKAEKKPKDDQKDDEKEKEKNSIKNNKQSNDKKTDQKNAIGNKRDRNEDSDKLNDDEEKDDLKDKTDKDEKKDKQKDNRKR